MRKTTDDSIGSHVFPTPTAGNGRLRPSSAKTGSGQGLSSAKRIAKCKQCGFPVDLNKTAHSGGDYEGNGGLGGVVKSTISATLLNGQTFTEEWGDRSVDRGSGCPHCGSRNIVA